MATDRSSLIARTTHGARSENWLAQAAGQCCLLRSTPAVKNLMRNSSERARSEIDIDLKTVAAVRHVTSLAATDGLFDRIATAVNNPESAIDKAHIVSIIKNRLANFRHVESEKNLDQRL